MSILSVLRVDLTVGIGCDIAQKCALVDFATILS